MLRLALVPLVLLLALPVLVILGSWGAWNADKTAILLGMLQTVLPQYLGNSVLLCIGVGAGVVSMGTVSALAVTLFEFPGRRVLAWALLLPLAMPAYVVAYAYSDYLQFSGPLQSALRQMLGLRGAMLPEVRSLGGAIFVLSVCLYPYVYLLARAALSERAIHLMEAARLLGARLPRRILGVALPLARPAITAGAALALMETLSDYGVCSYMGVTTFATGVFKAWLAMDNPQASIQLAGALLLLIALMLALERHMQSRRRFAGNRLGGGGAEESRPVVLGGAAAWTAFVLCLLPVLLGFVAPVLILLRELLGSELDLTLTAPRFLGWARNSLQLGLLAAVLSVLLAWLLASARRLRPGRDTAAMVALTGLGYAVPGVVIVVGLLAPLGWLQAWRPDWPVGAWLTTTITGLIWAYLVRFVAVALQSIESGYTRLPIHLDESARLLGTTGARLVARVHWPLLRRSLAAALLLVLVDVIKELPATLVLRPFDMDTLAVMAFQLARDERLGEAALPSLTLVLVGLAPVILLGRSLRRAEATRH